MKVSDDSVGKIMSLFCCFSALPAFMLPGQNDQFTQSKNKMLKLCRGCAGTVCDTPVLLQRVLCCCLCTQNTVHSGRNYFSTVRMKYKDPNDTYSWTTFGGFFFWGGGFLCGVCLGATELSLTEDWKKNILFCFRIFLNPCKNKIKWNNYHWQYADVKLGI